MSNNELKPVNVAISATFKPDPVKDYISWWGRQFGYDIDVGLSPGNDVIGQLTDDRSLLLTNKGVNILLVRFEDWIHGHDLSDMKKIKLLRNKYKEFSAILKEKAVSAPYFVGIFPVSTPREFSGEMMEHLESMYARLEKLVKKLDNVYPLDFRGLRELYEVETVFCKNGAPFTEEYFAAMGTTIARSVCAYTKTHFKVIVLDCDNTLWKGIAGEDGATGVIVDEGYRVLQRLMIEKYEQGFLIALCSKNNEPDVWEVFDRNEGMILKKDHLVHWKINWNTKSSNIEEMARELNLGVDSFVFIDDNPVECAEVMTDSPKVLSLRLPKESNTIPQWLKHVWAIDKIKVTEEDKKRTEMYRAEKKRMATQTESQSLDDFLASLELQVSMNKMKAGQVPRVAQLTQRTNQFNLSTIRRKEDDILNLEKEDDTMIWVVEISDKFGDYGIVGVIISRRKGNVLFLDSLLLSCRALGRGVESAMLAGLRQYCGEHGLESLEAHYFPTKKNKPLLGFMEDRWEKQEEHQDYTVFAYPLNEKSEKIDYVDFYYLEDYEKTHGGVQEDGAPPAAVERAEEDTGTTGGAAADTVIHFEWEVEKVNVDDLVHKHHLLPLEYHSAARIVNTVK